ncbi:MAG: YggT family protein [Deltaproteobacteria bacterium]|jgi:YggT family protein|nr:YggT family protein [Deltaproteobacteria bacterium]
MFVAGNFLGALAGLLDTVLTLYVWIIVGRAVISWVNADPYNPIVRMLCNLTDPVLDRLRQALPMSFGGIDMSPIVAIFIVWFLRAFFVTSLYDLARAVN